MRFATSLEAYSLELNIILQSFVREMTVERVVGDRKVSKNPDAEDGSCDMDWAVQAGPPKTKL